MRSWVLLDLRGVRQVRLQKQLISSGWNSAFCVPTDQKKALGENLRWLSWSPVYHTGAVGEKSPWLHEWKTGERRKKKSAGSNPGKRASQIFFFPFGAGHRIIKSHQLWLASTTTSKTEKHGEGRCPHWYERSDRPRPRGLYVEMMQHVERRAVGEKYNLTRNVRLCPFWHRSSALRPNREAWLCGRYYILLYQNCWNWSRSTPGLLRHVPTHVSARPDIGRMLLPPYPAYWESLAFHEEESVGTKQGDLATCYAIISVTAQLLVSLLISSKCYICDDS